MKEKKLKPRLDEVNKELQKMVNADIRTAIKTQTVIYKSQEEVLEIYSNLLNNLSKLRQAIGYLSNCNTTISKMNPKFIIEYLRNKEIKNQHRQDIINILNDGIRIIGRKQPGVCDEEFNEKKHLSLSRTFGPDYDEYHKFIKNMKQKELEATSR